MEKQQQLHTHTDTHTHPAPRLVRVGPNPAHPSHPSRSVSSCCLQERTWPLALDKSQENLRLNPSSSYSHPLI